MVCWPIFLTLSKGKCHLDSCLPVHYTHTVRGVAQSGSAPRLGRGGRRFESARPDNQLICYKAEQVKKKVRGQHTPPTYFFA